LEEASGSGGDFADGEVEGGGVGLGWFMKAGNFADELERSGADFVGRDGRIEVEKRFDAAAHESLRKKLEYSAGGGEAERGRVEGVKKEELAGTSRSAIG